MKYKAVVFDLDGTLLDTLKDLNEACNYSLSKYGYNLITEEETRLFIGNGIKKLIERALKNNLENFNEVFEAFKKYYNKNYNVYTKPYAGIIDIVKFLTEKKIKLAVFSNKDHIILNKLVEETFPNVFKIVLGDGASFPRKPDPSGLIYIAKEFDIKMDELLYIGDSDVDAMTIKNSGCLGICVSYGFRKHEDLVNAGANIIVDSTDKLLELLENNI
ncbi:MAG: HAD family hydrolase [Anaeroplasma sp.]|nr:HAD family hydrolase [Anaeroplasma sp.]